MKHEQLESLMGVVLDRQVTFTLHEFCRAAGTEQDFVRSLISEGVIEPLETAEDLQFHGEALLRAQRAQRLTQDLEVNLPGVALALDLLDELDQLRRDLQRLRRLR